MFKDKSRLFLLGALVLLFLALSSSGFDIHVLHFPAFHGFSVLRVLLIGLVIWFIFKGGCCGSFCGRDDEVDEADLDAVSKDDKEDA